jgi:cytochrome c biogenesis protein CcmG/thiol:disulfide interchange protein DsbE
MRAKLYRLTPLLLFWGIGFFLYKGLSLNPRSLPSVLINQSLPYIEVKNLMHPNKIFSSKDLQGSVSLLNVFASWCESCLAEHVFLMKLRDEGIQIYGLNYRDDSRAVKKFLKRYGNPYQAIGADTNGHAGMALGVYGVPETFLIDKSGRVRYRFDGVLTQNQYDKHIKTLIETLKAAS